MELSLSGWGSMTSSAREIRVAACVDVWGRCLGWRGRLGMDMDGVPTVDELGGRMDSCLES